jgi:hypothetical protein
MPLLLMGQNYGSSSIIVTGGFDSPQILYQNSTKGTGTGTFSWGHVGTTQMRGGIVHVAIEGTTTDVVSGVTWDGIAMTFVGREVRSTGEIGQVESYFLGSGLTTGTAPTITVTVSSGTHLKAGFATSLTTSGKERDLQLAGTFCTMTGSAADPTCTVTGITGASFGSCGLWSGRSIVSDLAVSDPFVRTIDNDFGISVAGVANFKNTYEQESGDVVFAWTVGTDEFAGVGLAVELVPL